jgi:hypothetical protein
MIRGFLYALIRIVIFSLAFYFVYKVIREFIAGLTGQGHQKPGKQTPDEQPPRQKSVETYSDVTDAKFKDIPPDKEQRTTAH